MAFEAIKFHLLFKYLHLSIFFFPLFTFENERSDLGLFFLYSHSRIRGMIWDYCNCLFFKQFSSFNHFYKSHIVLTTNILPQTYGLRSCAWLPPTHHDVNMVCAPLLEAPQLVWKQWETVWSDNTMITASMGYSGNDWNVPASSLAHINCKRIGKRLSWQLIVKWKRHSWTVKCFACVCWLNGRSEQLPTGTRRPENSITK
jgi:hypothetical protein